MVSGGISTQELIKQFSLLRRPYVAVADALERARNKLLEAQPTIKEVEPFDFTLYEPEHGPARNRVMLNEPDHELVPCWRFFLSYSADKFERILKDENRKRLKEALDTVFSYTKEEEIDKFYKAVLKQSETTENNLAFLAGVYHFSFSVKSPKEFFNPGIVHKVYTSRNRDPKVPLIARRFLKKHADKLQSLEINGEDFSQLPTKEAEDYFDKRSPFYQGWIESIQGPPSTEGRFDSYFPVYDGDEPGVGVLRGYLGVYCPKEATRAAILTDLFAQIGSVQRTINRAYLIGTHNMILDAFGYEPGKADPVIYVQEQLYHLHRWKQISVSPGRGDTIWTVQDNKLKISFARLLSEGTDDENSDLLFLHGNKSLVLTFPDDISAVDVNAKDNPYVHKRVEEVVGLFRALMAKRRILQAARKAAISQVMARNMSHNIGSHVLADLSTRQRLQEIVSRYYRGDDKHDLFDVNGRDTSSPDVALAAFFQYLKSRMDFLADLATSMPVVENQKFLEKDVIEPFNSNKLLSEKIPGLDTFRYTVVSYKQFDLAKPEQGQLTDTADTGIAFPNDILGAHALYVIIENFVRNCAKYEGTTTMVTIGLLPKDYDDDLVRIELFSSCQKDSTAIQKVIEERNKDIEASILEDGRLRRGAWGILEMKIAASYLRKIPIEGLDSTQEPPLLKAINFQQKNILGYQFYLRKPKELLVVHPDNFDSSLPQRAGIDYVPHSKLGASNVAFTHRLMLLIDATEPVHCTLSMQRNRFPLRDIAVKHDDSIVSLLKQEQEKTPVIAASVWQKWSEKVRGDKEIVCEKWDTQNAVVKKEELFKVPKNGSGQVFRAVFHLHCRQFKPNGLDYYETYRSSTNISRVLDRRVRDASLDHELVEAVLTKIAIVDERIQGFVLKEENKFLGEKLLVGLDKIGIRLPTKEEADLNAPNFDDQLKVSAVNWMSSRASEVHFVVVHLTILEKIYGTGAAKIAGILSELKESTARLIVISGRGRKPEDIPDEMLFLPYSTVSQFVIENRSKYHLTQLLYAARSRK